MENLMFLAIAYMFTDPMITLTDMFSAWETMCAGQLRSMTWATGDIFIMTEIVEQKIVSGCKNPFRTFYIAVMHYGVWLLIFCEGADANEISFG